MSPNETLSKALGTLLLETLLSNQQITEAYARPNTTGGFQEGRRDGRVGEKKGGRGEKAVKDRCFNSRVVELLILHLVHYCS